MGLTKIVFIIGVIRSCSAYYGYKPVECTEFELYKPAYEGYDPRISNMMSLPDPGRKNQIFRRCSTEQNSMPTNRFLPEAANIDRMREASSCNSYFTYSVVENLDDYTNEMNSMISFANLEDSVDLSNRFPNKDIIEHFEAGGAILFFKAKCITHSVGLNSFSAPYLTRNFQASISDLYLASLNKSSAYAKKTVNNFVHDFGTHFMETSYLGSKIVIQIKARGSQYRFRGATDDLAATASRLFFKEKNPNSFKELSSKACQVINTCSPDAVSIVSTGPGPHNLSMHWRDAAAEAPVVIQFKLKKISALFSESWFSETSYDHRSLGPFNGSRDVNLDGKPIQEVLDFYDWLNVGHKPIPAHPFDLSPDESVTPKSPSQEAQKIFSSLDDHYDILIMTGGKSSSNSALTIVTTVGTRPLPELPEGVYSHTLTYIGDGEVLQVGGIGSTKALKINITADDPQWTEIKGLEIFNNKTNITTVKLQDQDSPWIISDSKLFTIGPSGTIVTRELPFNITGAHCAVANDQHVFVIGVGVDGNEIWVNFEPSDPSSFRLINKLTKSKRSRHCIWVGDRIFVMRDMDDGYGEQYNNVESLDVSNGILRHEGCLYSALSSFSTLIWKGYPAVIGVLSQPQNSNDIKTKFEYYNSEEMTWISPDISIDVPGASFALVQIPSSEL